MSRVTVILKHAPIVLRVDEMRQGEGGIAVARQIGEMTLASGANEVDAELWGKWIEQNKDGPLVKNGLIEEQKPQEGTSDGESRS